MKVEDVQITMYIYDDEGELSRIDMMFIGPKRHFRKSETLRGSLHLHTHAYVGLICL